MQAHFTDAVGLAALRTRDEWLDVEKQLIRVTVEQLTEHAENPAVFRAYPGLVEGVLSADGCVVPESFLQRLQQETEFTYTSSTHCYIDWVTGRLTNGAPTQYRVMGETFEAVKLALCHYLVSKPRAGSPTTGIGDALSRQFNSLTPETRDRVLAATVFHHDTPMSALLSRNVPDEATDALHATVVTAAIDLFPHKAIRHLKGVGYLPPETISIYTRSLGMQDETTQTRLVVRWFSLVLQKLDAKAPVTIGSWFTSPIVPNEHYQTVIDRGVTGLGRDSTSAVTVWAFKAGAALRVLIAHKSAKIHSFVGSGSDRAMRAAYLLCYLHGVTYLADVPFERRRAWFQCLGLEFEARRTCAHYDQPTEFWAPVDAESAFSAIVVRTTRHATRLMTVPTSVLDHTLVPREESFAHCPYDRYYLADDCMNQFTVPAFDLPCLERLWVSTDTTPVVDSGLLRCIDHTLSLFGLSEQRTHQIATELTESMCLKSGVVDWIRRMPLNGVCASCPTMAALFEVVRMRAFQHLWLEGVSNCADEDTPLIVWDAIVYRLTEFAEPAFAAAAGPEHRSAPTDATEVDRVVGEMQRAYPLTDGALTEEQVAELASNPYGVQHGGIWLKGVDPATLTTRQYAAHRQAARKWAGTWTRASTGLAVLNAEHRLQPVFAQREAVARCRVQEAHEAMCMFEDARRDPGVTAHVLLETAASSYFSPVMVGALPSSLHAYVESLVGSRAGNGRGVARIGESVSDPRRAAAAHIHASRSPWRHTDGHPTADIDKLLANVRAWDAANSKTGVPVAIADYLRSNGVDVHAEHTQTMCALWLRRTSNRATAMAIAEKRVAEKWKAVCSVVSELARAHGTGHTQRGDLEMSMRIRVAQCIGSWGFVGSLPLSAFVLIQENLPHAPTTHRPAQRIVYDTRADRPAQAAPARIHAALSGTQANTEVVATRHHEPSEETLRDALRWDVDPADATEATGRAYTTLSEIVTLRRDLFVQVVTKEWARATSQLIPASHLSRTFDHALTNPQSVFSYLVPKMRVAALLRGRTNPTVDLARAVPLSRVVAGCATAAQHPDAVAHLTSQVSRQWIVQIVGLLRFPEPNEEVDAILGDRIRRVMSGEGDAIHAAGDADTQRLLHTVHVHLNSLVEGERCTPLEWARIVGPPSIPMSFRPQDLAADVHQRAISRFASRHREEVVMAAVYLVKFWHTAFVVPPSVCMTTIGRLHELFSQEA